MSLEWSPAPGGGASAQTSAAEQVQDARIWGGIHFRFSTQTGAEMGAEVAQYVMRMRLPPRHGRD